MCFGIEEDGVFWRFCFTIVLHFLSFFGMRCGGVWVGHGCQNGKYDQYSMRAKGKRSWDRNSEGSW